MLDKYKLYPTQQLTKFPPNDSYYYDKLFVGSKLKPIFLCQGGKPQRMSRNPLVLAVKKEETAIKEIRK